jgi:hypothetical protein
MQASTDATCQVNAMGGVDTRMTKPAKQHDSIQAASPRALASGTSGPASPEQTPPQICRIYLQHQEEQHSKRHKQLITNVLFT